MPSVEERLRYWRDRALKAEALLTGPAPAARSGAVNEPVSSHWPEAHEVADIVAEGNGFWRSCSGCHELNEGHPTGPWSVTLGCNLGCGCDECGGIGAVWDTTDYADMGEALAALEPAEPATGAEPVGVGVFRNGKMIGFVVLDGEEYKLPEDTDERKLLYTSPQPKTATDEGPVAWLMNGKGDNWEERNVVTFDEDTARMKADTEWWTVHPLFTSPQPESRLREALEEITNLKTERDRPDDYNRGFADGRWNAVNIARAALAQEDGRNE